MELAGSLVFALLSCGMLSAQAEAWRAQPLGEVRFGGEFGRRLEMTVTNNFLRIDRSEFLTPFVEKRQKQGYIALGKFIDSAVSLAKQTGRADVRAIKEEAVATVLRHQQPDGYPGALAPKGRLWEIWDAHEVAYLIYGLMSDWEEFGNTAALDGARRAADWVIANWPTMPKDWRTSFVNEPMYTIGQCRAFLRLYAATRERRYLDFVLRERRLAELDTPIFIGRAEMMWGHAYTYLENCLAQLMLWQGSPDPKLLRPTERAFDFMLNRNGALVTGGSGIAECWTDSQDGDGDVGETCATVYEIFCADAQIRLGLGDASRLGDFMERTVWNALFAAQSKDGRRIRYYTPLLGRREYYDGDKYCCPNNYRRLIPHLGRFALYVRDDAVLANLYTPLETTVAVGGTRVKIRETTDYPTDEKVVFAVEPGVPTEFGLHLRIPAWCTNATLAVNGRAANAALRPGTTFALNRKWTAGDRVELTLPMSLRVVRGRRRQAGRIALVRGPLVYAFDPAEAARRQPDGKEGVRAKDVFLRHPFDVQAAMQVDPRGVKVVRDDTVRPGGTALEASVSYESFSVGVDPKWGSTRVKFTEYADPDATITYFRTPDIERDACADELFK